MSYSRILATIADLLNEQSIYDATDTEDYLEIHDPECDTDYVVELKPLN